MTTGTEAKIRAMLLPILEREALSLYDMELVLRPGNSLLRIFIDRPGGVSLSHCEMVSNHLSTLLDVDDPFSSPYLLEVSSPGLTRKLTKHEHFVKSVGNYAKVTFKKSFNGPTEAKGDLELNTDGRFRLAVDGGKTIEFGFEDVAHAKLDIKP